MCEIKVRVEDLCKVPSERCTAILDLIVEDIGWRVIHGYNSKKEEKVKSKHGKQ